MWLYIIDRKNPQCTLKNSIITLWFDKLCLKIAIYFKGKFENVKLWRIYISDADISVSKKYSENIYISYN